MYNLITMELKNCLRRVEIKVIFFLFFIISIGSFLYECYRVYGEQLTYIRSAYEMSILQSTSSGIIFTIELMLLPLLAPIIYSDSLYSDLKSGSYKSIVTRVSKQRYIWAKSIVVLITTFCTVFIPLLINQLLCLITFPTTGYDNRFAYPPYDIGIQNFDPQAPLDLLRLMSPLLYNITYMLLISLTASIFALFTYSLFILYQKNKFISLSGGFILITIINLLVSLIISYQWGYNHILVPTNRGSLLALWIWLFSLSIFAIAVIISTRKKELGIDI